MAGYQSEYPSDVISQNQYIMETIFSFVSRPRELSELTFITRLQALVLQSAWQESQPGLPHMALLEEQGEYLRNKSNYTWENQNNKSKTFVGGLILNLPSPFLVSLSLLSFWFSTLKHKNNMGKPLVAGLPWKEYRTPWLGQGSEKTTWPGKVKSSSLWPLCPHFLLPSTS